MMELVHIFYKELVADEENVFNLNISEKNEVENAKFSNIFDIKKKNKTKKFWSNLAPEELVN